MRINFNSIFINMNEKGRTDKSHSQSELEKELLHLIEEYFPLKIKIENPEQQSWYFQHGIVSQVSHFSYIKKRFETIRKEINESSVQEIKENIKELETEMSLFERFSCIDKWHSLYMSIQYQNDLIDLKTEIGQLMPIEYYQERREIFGKTIE